MKLEWFGTGETHGAFILQFSDYLPAWLHSSHKFTLGHYRSCWLVGELGIHTSSAGCVEHVGKCTRHSCDEGSGAPSVLSAPGWLELALSSSEENLSWARLGKT